MQSSLASRWEWPRTAWFHRLHCPSTTHPLPACPPSQVVGEQGLKDNRALLCSHPQAALWPSAAGPELLVSLPRHWLYLLRPGEECHCFLGSGQQRGSSWRPLTPAKRRRLEAAWSGKEVAAGGPLRQQRGSSWRLFGPAKRQQLQTIRTSKESKEGSPGRQAAGPRGRQRRMAKEGSAGSWTMWETEVKADKWAGGHMVEATERGSQRAAAAMPWSRQAR